MKRREQQNHATADWQELPSGRQTEGRFPASRLAWSILLGGLAQPIREVRFRCHGPSLAVSGTRESTVAASQNSDVLLDHRKAKQRAKIPDPLAEIPECRTTVYAIPIGVDIPQHFLGVN